MMRRVAQYLLLLGLLAPCVEAFYLPGAAPHNYEAGERVELFVNALAPIIGKANNAKLVHT